MKNPHHHKFFPRLKPGGITLALSGILALALAGCRLPGSPAPTPFVFTTPDRTLTAIFAPLLTLTPEPPQVFTATPESIQPSPFPSPTPSFTAEMPATATHTHTRPAPTLRASAQVEASYLENPPILDGILDEWSLTAYPVRNVVYGAQQWQGEADASATVMVGWDQTYLYLAVQVRDDRYVQEASGANIFKGDSLEILLDSDLAGDFEVKSLNADDFQLGISPGSPYPGQNPQAFLWFPSSRQGSRTDVSIAARGREGGYNVETVIPWSLFGITPQNGDAFGFAVSVSDNDLEGEQVQQSMVSNVSTRSLTDPTSWGSLVLLKP
jgi:hypothetical protein